MIRVPTGVILGAMAVAAGAAVGSDGLPLQGGSGTLTPREGGVWRGAPGFATGHGSMTTFEDVILPKGMKVNLRWVHALYRTPVVPFQPHVDLHRRVFANLTDIPGGYFVGDHPNCTCGMVPTLMPVLAPVS